MFSLSRKHKFGIKITSLSILPSQLMTSVNFISFKVLKWFYTISICWLEKLYDFTSQLAILTTLSTIVYIYILCKKFIDEMDCEHEATFIWVLIIWVECGWIAIMFVDFKMWDKFWIGSCAVETLDTLIIC